MKHKITQELFSYWNTLRDGRPAPRRSNIEPRDIRRILPNVFILERKDRWSYTFRLAGTGLCNIYGMEFRGHNMLSFWQHDSQTQLSRLLNDVTGSASIGLVDYIAQTPDKREVGLEMILLPLAQDNGAITRIMGAALPVDDQPWIGDHMLTHQWIERAQLIDPNQLADTLPARQTAEKILWQKPPRPARAPIAAIGTRQSQNKSERPYLRLVDTDKAVAKDNN